MDDEMGTGEHPGPHRHKPEIDPKLMKGFDNGLDRIREAARKRREQAAAKKQPQCSAQTDEQAVVDSDNDIPMSIN
jgi:hypothetical protein